MTTYRYGRGQAAILREAVHQRLLVHEEGGELPTSNRFLLYELRQAGGPLYGHKSRGQGRSEDQNLSDACMWLRAHRLVPWDWIVDETRSLTVPFYANTVAEYAAAAIDGARIDCWSGKEPPLLLCESRTFGGVIQRTLAQDYLCPVAATNGQVGGFLHVEIVPILVGNDRPVLYVGDHDVRGYDIEANTRRVLEEAAGARECKRVALTGAQVETHGLPVVQKVDRVKGTHPAVEVEALGQGVVTGILRAELDARLPEPLEVVREREAEQREAERRRLLESRS
jgi:hypothetical protein